MRNNMVFEVSAKLMMSSGYQDRFLALYMQLNERYNRLCEMLRKWDTGELNFNPTCPREIYTIQIKAMKEYLDALVIRAKIENIELNYA